MNEYMREKKKVWERKGKIKVKDNVFEEGEREEEERERAWATAIPFKCLGMPWMTNVLL